MKVSTIVATVACFSTALAHRSWKAPTATDRRSPCPMVNTLANHGYLARNGLNISMADLVIAFNESLNLAPAATQLVGAKALLTSTTGDATTFNLDDLDQHGVIEHDGSLSRADTSSGDNHSFNLTIWSSVAAHFTNATIPLSTAILARSARLAAAAASNPVFNMSASDVQFSGIETALYMSVFAVGNATAATAAGTVRDARTDWVQSLFVRERLPYELGWTRPAEQMTVAGILGLMAKIIAAS